MSATVPGTVAGTPPEENAPAARCPWPRVTLRLGGSVFELRGLTVFVRFVGAEIYICTAEVSDWWTLREPGCLEAAMGRVRVSASKATATHDF